ncbi:hypothetical protein CYANOKiyG1_60010 [Okeania sp. KiyG1]|nr:hypothetical protein CYANOKiyG1_60010 [Okeania sp. KiyG1]
MLYFERALKQDRLLRALTGLNRKAFQSLLLAFTHVYEQTLTDKPRQRSVGGDRLQPILEAALGEKRHYQNAKSTVSKHL